MSFETGNFRIQVQSLRGTCVGISLQINAVLAARTEKVIRVYAHKILVEKPEGKNHLGNLRLDGRITLKWVLREILYECVHWIQQP